MTCARLDHIGLVFEPGNSAAVVQATPAVLRSFDLLKASVQKAIQIVERLQVITREPVATPREHSLLNIKAGAGVIYGPYLCAQ